MALVALRMVVGWHFFSEGLSHYHDRNWTSAGFLQQAKGPLRPLYQSVIPAYHRWDEYLYNEQEMADALDQWATEVKDAWEDYRRQFAEYYDLNDRQREETRKIIDRRRVQLDEWLEKNRGAVGDHRHQWTRLISHQQEPGARQIPFKQKRIAEAQARLRADVQQFVDQVRSVEEGFRAELVSVLEGPQQDAGSFPAEATMLGQVDRSLTYGLLAIGALLIVGLFTRVAAVCGALFLLSIALAQPFWVAESQPTFNQIVEMFALVALATTAVGRWGGLDYFIHYLIVEPIAARQKRHEA